VPIDTTLPIRMIAVIPRAATSSNRIFMSRKLAPGGRFATAGYPATGRGVAAAASARSGPGEWPRRSLPNINRGAIEWDLVGAGGRVARDVSRIRLTRTGMRALTNPKPAKSPPRPHRLHLAAPRLIVGNHWGNEAACAERRHCPPARHSPRPSPLPAAPSSELHQVYALRMYSDCIIPATLAHIHTIMHTRRLMFVQTLAKPKSKRWRPCRETRP
jgi:hypothetical protein